MSGSGDRVKQLFKKYGKVAIGVHLTVYASFFTGCYVALENHVDVKGPLQRIGLLSKKDPDAVEEEQPPKEPSWLDKALSGGSSSLALAFLCNKALFPIRTPITLGMTPVVARLLRIRAANKLPSP